MKILSVGAESFHVDGRTDMTKLTVAYSNFVKALKTGRLSFQESIISSTASMKIYTPDGGRTPILLWVTASRPRAAFSTQLGSAV
jgi:hypothetical protein